MAVMPPLILRSTFASSPFQVRFKSVSSHSQEWDLHGSYIGVTWELRGY